MPLFDAAAAAYVAPYKGTAFYANFQVLTLNAPIATKVVCFSRLLKCYIECYRSNLFWVQAVCFYTQFVSNVRQLFAADDFNRRYFQMHFFSWLLKG